MIIVCLLIFLGMSTQLFSSEMPKIITGLSVSYLVPEYETTQNAYFDPSFGLGANLIYSALNSIQIELEYRYSILRIDNDLERNIKFSVNKGVPKESQKDINFDAGSSQMIMIGGRFVLTPDALNKYYIRAGAGYRLSQGDTEITVEKESVATKEWDPCVAFYTGWGGLISITDMLLLDCQLNATFIADKDEADETDLIFCFEPKIGIQIAL